MDKNNYTSTGLKKAGASLPDEVGAGGRANIRLSNIAESADQVDRRVMHIKRLGDAIGYNLMDDKKLEQSKTEITSKLRIKNVHQDKKSLVMWMKAMREDYAKNNIKLMENSFGSDLRNFIEMVAKDQDLNNVSCKVYPVFLYKEIGFPGVIDMVVDVDFDNKNKYSEPIFRTFKVSMLSDPAETFIQHERLSKQGVNYTVQAPKNNTEDYVEQLRSVAETILADAKEIYDKVHKNHDSTDIIKKAQRGESSVTVTKFN